jgi:predicted nucleic acid-binding protein
VIAVDTSSLRRFLSGATGADVELVAELFEEGQVVMPPAVLTEILREPNLQRATIEALSGLPLLAISEGYWSRAGLLRAKVIAAGFKAKVADALIAQSCIDHRVALITSDRDFRHFESYGLRLV